MKGKKHFTYGKFLAQSLPDRVLNLVNNYPGYCLNLLGILICIFLNISHIESSIQSFNEKMLAVKNATNLAMSTTIAKAKKSELAASELRMKISLLLQESVIDVVRKMDPIQSSQSQTDKVSSFLNQLNCYEYIRKTSTYNKDEQVSKFCNEVATHLKRDYPFLSNQHVVVVWILAAAMYVLAVGFSYLGWNLEIDQGEPILNIIDIGLYLALIEYTGGFESPIMHVIPISIIIAIVDLNRLVKIIRIKFHSFRVAWRMKEFSTIFSTLSPSLLYLFALCSGLIWSTIGLEYSTVGQSYWVMYLSKLMYVSFFGIIGICVFYLTTKYITQNH